MAHIQGSGWGWGAELALSGGNQIWAEFHSNTYHRVLILDDLTNPLWSWLQPPPCLNWEVVKHKHLHTSSLSPLTLPGWQLAHLTTLLSAPLHRNLGSLWAMGQEHFKHINLIMPLTLKKLLNSEQHLRNLPQSENKSRAIMEIPPTTSRYFFIGF